MTGVPFESFSSAPDSSFGVVNCEDEVSGVFTVE